MKRFPSTDAVPGPAVVRHTGPSSPTRAAVTFDRSAEPWTGHFAGLGDVMVHADGSVEVAPEVSPDTDVRQVELREAALRHGWGEQLSWLRRGFELAVGTAMAPPEGAETAGRALLLHGDAHDCAVMALGLSLRGWRLLADRLVPVTWQANSLLAHPRGAPLVVSRRRASKAEVTGRPLRDAGDALALDVPAADEPLPVDAFAVIRTRRPADPLVEVLRGADRLEAVGGVIACGALAPAVTTQPTAAEVMARDLRLASTATVRVCVGPDDPGEALTALEAWWAQR